jgi:hypothetical protein
LTWLSERRVDAGTGLIYRRAVPVYYHKPDESRAPRNISNHVHATFFPDLDNVVGNNREYCIRCQSVSIPPHLTSSYLHSALAVEMIALISLFILLIIIISITFFQQRPSSTRRRPQSLDSSKFNNTSLKYIRLQHRPPKTDYTQLIQQNSHLSSTLQSLRKDLSDNSFAAFKDRLILNNEIWKQEREIQVLRNAAYSGIGDTTSQDIRALEEQLEALEKKYSVEIEERAQRDRFVEELVRDILSELDDNQRLVQLLVHDDSDMLLSELEPRTLEEDDEWLEESSSDTIWSPTSTLVDLDWNKGERRPSPTNSPPRPRTRSQSPGDLSLHKLQTNLAHLESRVRIRFSNFLAHKSPRSDLLLAVDTPCNT